MENYSLKIDMVWTVVEKLVQDWQKNPFAFESERDIQAELYSRLSTVCRLLGKETVAANYSEVYDHLKIKPQEWGRVCCEPKTRYDWESKNAAVCRPDVVIWKDIPDIDPPPDADDSNNFPMLWACEIKLRGKKEPLSSEELMNQAKEKGDWDLKKIEDLLKKEDLDYGCALYFSWSRASGTDKGYHYELDEKDDRLKIWAVQLPSLEWEKEQVWLRFPFVRGKQ